MIKHIHVRGLNAGGVLINRKIEIQGEAENVIDESVAIGANQLNAFVLDVSQLKSLFIDASGGDLTIKTNSSGSPANTFNVVNGHPFAWCVGDGTLKDTGGTVVSTDVTALYITNASGGAVDLVLRALFDPTV